MKNHKIELNVDTIGGQGSLTIEEEKALSTFFKQRKLTSARSSDSKRPRTVKAQKVKV
jgi:hypothetical protein